VRELAVAARVDAVEPGGADRDRGGAGAERALVRGGIDAECEPADDGEAGAAERRGEGLGVAAARGGGGAGADAGGLGLPTIASCGKVSTSARPRTNNTSGGSGASASRGG
jgi:hypothetical protein